jgi:hypothetical protein
MFVGVTLTSRTRQENINLVGYYHPCHFKNGMNLPTLQNGAPSTKTWVCKGKVIDINRINRINGINTRHRCLLHLEAKPMLEANCIHHEI